MKILIVEDTRDSRYLIAYVLKERGHEVIEAESGEEAVALASDEAPDLVLMDIQLPGMDGTVATAIIRQYAPHMPIVAITAYAMIGDRESILEAGFTGYIEKPFKMESFVKDIEKYLPEPLDSEDKGHRTKDTP